MFNFDDFKFQKFLSREIYLFRPTFCANTGWFTVILTLGDVLFLLLGMAFLWPVDVSDRNCQFLSIPCAVRFGNLKSSKSFAALYKTLSGAPRKVLSQKVLAWYWYWFAIE